MRRIERSSAFKKDYKREARGQHRSTLDTSLLPILSALVADLPLEPRCRDHELTGDWVGYRECHIKPDLLLIYKRPDEETLWLARLGSHSEFFG